MDGHGAVSSGTYNWKVYCVRQNSEVALNIPAPLLYVPCLIIFPLVCTEPVNIRGCHSHDAVMDQLNLS